MRAGTRHAHGDAQTAMLTYDCRYCGAAAGLWCRTSGGHLAALLHACRWYDWRGVAPHHHHGDLGDCYCRAGAS